MPTETKLIDFRELLAKDLQDPAFRDYWERTALARAVAIAVLGYRIEHGLTQTALARLLGVRQPHVARLEIGEHNPSIEMLRRLSRALSLRFVVEVAPAGRDGDLGLPPGVKVLEHVTTADGSRVLVAAG